MTANWQDQAACRGMDPAIFFPDKGESTLPARRVCARCPVRPECLGGALERREEQGVWGGETVSDRRRTVSRQLAAAVCGTDSGYTRHVRTTRTAPCEACKAAHAEATRLRYRRNNEPRLGCIPDERESQRARKRARIGRLLEAGWCVQCAAGAHGNCHGNCACDRPHQVAS